MADVELETIFPVSSPEKKRPSGPFSWLRRLGGGSTKEAPPATTRPKPTEGATFEQKASWRKSGSYVLDVFKKGKGAPASASSGNLSLPKFDTPAGDLAFSINSPTSESAKEFQALLEETKARKALDKSVSAPSATASAPPADASISQPPAPESLAPSSSSPSLPSSPSSPSSPSPSEPKPSEASTPKRQPSEGKVTDAEGVVSKSPSSSSSKEPEDDSLEKSKLRKKSRSRSRIASAITPASGESSATPKQRRKHKKGSSIPSSPKGEESSDKTRKKKKKKKRKERSEGSKKADEPAPAEKGSPQATKEPEPEKIRKQEEDHDLTPKLDDSIQASKSGDLPVIVPASVPCDEDSSHNTPTPSEAPVPSGGAAAAAFAAISRRPTGGYTPVVSRSSPALDLTSTAIVASDPDVRSPPPLQKTETFGSLSSTPSSSSQVHALLDQPKNRGPGQAIRFQENRRSLRIGMPAIRSLFGGSGSKLRAEVSEFDDLQSIKQQNRRSLRLTETFFGSSSSLGGLSGNIPNNNSSGAKSGTEEERSGSKRRTGSQLRGSDLRKRQDEPAAPLPSGASQPESEVIIANSFDELPKDIQRKITLAKIDPVMLENPDYWRTMCNIIHFRLKKRIVPVDDKPQKKVKDNFRHLDMTIEEAEAFYFTPDDPKRNPKKIYKNFLDCGKGGYGRVFSAASTIDKEKVAIKKMPHITEKDKRHNLSEIRFLHQISHPNICKYLRTHWLKDEVWIVMEYMQGGTLNEAAKQHDFSENEIAYVAREVLLGLQFLHKMNWVHRDLKSSNIMLTTGGDIKLIDFGLCIDVTQGGSTHMCGSPYWMSPEMIRKEIHGTVADIWSLGISLLELANKHPPHHKNALLALFTAATVGYPQPFEKPNQWGDEMKHFLGACLTLDPAKRPDSERMLAHAFLLQAVDKKVMEGLFSRIFLTNTIMARGF